MSAIRPSTRIQRRQGASCKERHKDERDRPGEDEGVTAAEERLLRVLVAPGSREAARRDGGEGENLFCCLQSGGCGELRAGWRLHAPPEVD